MGPANELPFGFPLGDAPQGEWAETAGVFDLTEHWLTEHWLDWSFWFLVEVAPCFRPQRTGQTRLRGERSRDATTRDGRQSCVMFQSLRGAVRGQVVRANGWRVVVAGVARVGHEIFRTLSDLGGLEVGFHPVEQRGDLSDLVGLRRDLGGEEELRFIDQGLGIAAPARPD